MEKEESSPQTVVLGKKERFWGTSSKVYGGGFA